MTYHDDGIPVWHLVLFSEEGTPVGSLHTDHVEVVSGHCFAPDLFDLVRTAEFVLTDTISSEPAENFVAFAKVEVTGIGRGVIWLLCIATVELDDLLRIRNR